MWKRLNNPKADRQQPIRSPVFNETTLDRNAYEYGLGIDVSPAQSPADRSGPARPLREHVPKGLPSLPFEPIQPPAPERPDSTVRLNSSIYSQPRPNPITSQLSSQTWRTSHAPSTPYADDVSPPSSPDTENALSKGRPGQDDHDVSPIDRTPDNSYPDLGRPSSKLGASLKPQSSHIPVLRRERRRNKVAAVAANLVSPLSRKDVGNPSAGRKSADVRWDPYSGEQTTSEKGKIQSVKPGQFTPPTLRTVHEPTPLGNETKVTVEPNSQQSWADRIRKGTNNVSEERPGWKGASGRVAVVSPVADQLDTRPLRIPRKSSKRVASPDSEPSPSVSVIRRGSEERHPASALMADNNGATTMTVESGSGLLNSQVSAAQEPLPNASSSNVEHREDTPLSYTPGNSSDPYVQPPSRFSVTTYAPSETQSTPRLSTETFDPPPMPSPPQDYATAKQPSPIANRKPKTATRKAVNPSSPVFISMSDSVNSKRVSNIAKTLPQSPAEAESHDLVTSLQAQLDNLAHRRINIMKSIRQMTELMPTDGVMVTNEVRRKREEEKRKVEGLREEEADVRRQEHEIGLRLHRAWKRRDKDAVYEQTGLWVRRVTE